MSLKELNKITHPQTMLLTQGFSFPSGMKKHRLLGPWGRSQSPMVVLPTRYCILIPGNQKAGPQGDASEHPARSDCNGDASAVSG